MVPAEHGDVAVLLNTDLPSTTTMPSPSILKTQAQASSEPKSRGANRSTKAAGKLKVLPEQPDLPNPKPGYAPGPSNDTEESMGTTGESDEADIDDDEPEVRKILRLPSSSFTLMYTGV